MRMYTAASTSLAAVGLLTRVWCPSQCPLRHCPAPTDEGRGHGQQKVRQATTLSFPPTPSDVLSFQSDEVVANVP